MSHLFACDRLPGRLGDAVDERDRSAKSLTSVANDAPAFRFHPWASRHDATSSSLSSCAISFSLQ